MSMNGPHLNLPTAPVWYSRGPQREQSIIGSLIPNREIDPRLIGRWKILSAKVSTPGGEGLDLRLKTSPGQPGSLYSQGAVVSIEGKQLAVWTVDESTGKLATRVQFLPVLNTNRATVPSQMDFFFIEPPRSPVADNSGIRGRPASKGFPLPGVYRLEGDRLTVAYANGSRPNGFSTKLAEHSRALYVFELQRVAQVKPK